MTPLLSASELAVLRGERLLFRDLEFALGRGDCLLVEGANGAGKTSLMRVVAGLLPPAAGSVSWTGSDIRVAGQAYRAHVAWYGHRAGLKGDLTLVENLRAEAALRPRGRARLPEVLERLGLADLTGLPVGVLSAGQQRRAALARLLLADATLWLLDEPLTNLDGDGQRLVNALVAEHVAGGGLCLLASHRDVDSGLPTQRIALS